MYHYFDDVRTPQGPVLAGFYVRLVDSTTGETASLYADENETPIITSSGIADAALVDGDGNVDLYVAAGTYHLDYYAPDGVTFVKRVRNVPMTQNIFDVSTIVIATDNGFGYATGNGGQVTQLTSRTTAVEINTVSGQITLFSDAGSPGWQTFVVNNDKVSGADTVSLAIHGGSNFYICACNSMSDGAFAIAFVALSGTATDAPIINFNIIKGTAS